MMAARGLTAEAVAESFADAVSAARHRLAVQAGAGGVDVSAPVVPADEAQAIVDALLRGGPYAAPEVDDCRALWAAVLLECWLTAAMPVVDQRMKRPNVRDQRMDEAKACRAWFGSPDFHLVCAFIGFDSDAVLRAFRAGVVPVIASKMKGRSKESRGQAA